MKSSLLALTVSLLLLIVCACHRQVALEKKNVPTLLARAVENSQLTLAGSKPFHLKANVVEATNLENDSYNAEIEEYWVAPDKWRRIVKTEKFSSDIVVNGDRQSGSMSGDYYPNWLRTLVTAIFDPSVPVRQLDLTAPSDNPMAIGSALFCRRYSSRVGIPPAANTVFSTVCFDGDRLQSIQLPGFNAEYKKYEDFNGKHFSRKILEEIEPGTELEATITELTELAPVDESMFAVAEPASNRPQTITVNEDMLRRLANDPLDLKWPPIRGGKTEGTLSVYICLDRTGKVREAYDLNSDHPGMSDAARQQLSSIRFAAPQSNGKPAQVEGILTFAYKTIVTDPYPELTGEAARERVITLVEPSFQSSVPKGSVVTVSALVDENGNVGEADVTGSIAGVVWSDFSSWKFRPLVRDGKPTAYKAVLKFVAH